MVKPELSRPAKKRKKKEEKQPPLTGAPSSITDASYYVRTNARTSEQKKPGGLSGGLTKRVANERTNERKKKPGGLSDGTLDKRATAAHQQEIFTLRCEKQQMVRSERIIWRIFQDKRT